MLYSLGQMKKITAVPHAAEFKVWTSRLSPQDLKAIKDELNKRVNKGEVHTSSWMPGHNWAGTPFLPIWEKACLKNVDAAAKCFGLILWQVMMDRPEAWTFGRYALKDIKIEGMTYFQIDAP